MSVKFQVEMYFLCQILVPFSVISLSLPSNILFTAEGLQYRNVYFLPENCTINENSCLLYLVQYFSV